MKEFLKETQPIFYRILEKSFKENKKTHAFLLVGDHTDDIATFIAQSYICHEDTLACETYVMVKRLLLRNLILIIFRKSL